MNFVGSIGSVMKGPGLEEALETVYGPNAVTHTQDHMMSGKAISRALAIVLRGHFLVKGRLVNKLMSELLLPCKLKSNLICSKSLPQIKRQQTMVAI